MSGNTCNRAACCLQPACSLPAILINLIIMRFDKPRTVQIAVIGAGDAGQDLFSLAERAGRAIAAAGCTLVCGGLGGVMAGACKGAKEAGGKTVAIIPGTDSSTANPWAEVVIVSGLGHARNALVVQSAQGVVAMPGSWGTMSEIALSIKMGKPVAAVDSWKEISGVLQTSSPESAVEAVLRMLTENV